MRNLLFLFFTQQHSRKKITLQAVLVFSLLHSIPAFSSPPSFYRDAYSTAPGGWIFNVWTVTQYMHYKAQPGNLSVSFPYTLTAPGSPVAVNRVFSSEHPDLIQTGKFPGFGLGLEIGKENFSIYASLGLYYHQWSDNLYAGINYRFILKKLHASPEKINLATTSFPGRRTMRTAAAFPVKISLGIFYYQPLWKLGEVALGNNEFNALGYTLQDHDSMQIGDAGNLTVFFHQNIIALKPAISIGYQPGRVRLIFSFTASPLIILSQSGGLRFYVTNSGAVDWAPRNGIDPEAVIPLDKLGLDATFNGEELHSTPFKLQGWLFTLKIGFRLAGN